MKTVTIDESTHRKLKKLKQERGASSFDELLNELAEKELEIPSAEDMFGSMNIEDRGNIREKKDNLQFSRPDKAERT